MWTIPGFKDCSLVRVKVSSGSHIVHARPLQNLRQVCQEAGPPILRWAKRTEGTGGRRREELSQKQKRMTVDQGLEGRRAHVFNRQRRPGQLSPNRAKSKA